MTSQAQKKAGYPIPEDHTTEETQELCIIIPAGDDFRRAAYAQLLMLGKWWLWKHDESPESTRAKETAEVWRLAFELNEECGMSCEEIEDCLEASELLAAMQAEIDAAEADIVTNTTNITNVTNQVTVLEQNVTQTNIVPPISDLETEDEICNAATYIAQQILAEALSVWEQSGELTIEEFIQALLTNSNGWLGTFATDLYNAAVPADMSTPDDLTDAYDALERALYCNNLDKAAARAEILASPEIEENARDLIIAVLDALTDAKYALWAFVGKETIDGTCDCTIEFNVWSWNYISFPCVYGLPDGWTLVVNEGICGSNTGLINGIHNSSNNSSPTTCIFTITPASGTVIREINYNGVKKSGGTASCQVAIGGYSDTDTLLATVEGFYHTMNETGAIVFTLTHTGSGNNGVAVQALNVSYE